MRKSGFSSKDSVNAERRRRGEGAQAGTRPAALVRLEQAHTNLEALADLMETIADTLPRPNRTACMHAVALLSGELPLHHADEDLGLFPVLRERCTPEDRIDVVLNQLEAEHVDDEATLAEIVPILSGLAQQGQLEIEPSAIGYALRGFFEAQRRHLAWERALVIPLARTRLTAMDWQRVAAAMQANRRGPTPDALARRNCGTSGGYQDCLRRARTISMEIDESEH